MATGKKLEWKRVGSWNAKLERIAKRFIEQKHPETYDAIVEIWRPNYFF
jgi:hypothetical protein